MNKTQENTEQVSQQYENRYDVEPSGMFEEYETPLECLADEYENTSHDFDCDPYFEEQFENAGFCGDTDHESFYEPMDNFDVFA